jgi:hypothetical protein
VQMLFRMRDGGTIPICLPSHSCPPSE